MKVKKVVVIYDDGGSQELTRSEVLEWDGEEFIADMEQEDLWII